LLFLQEVALNWVDQDRGRKHKWVRKELSCVQIHFLELKFELGFEQTNGEDPNNDEHGHLYNNHEPLSWFPLLNITTDLWRKNIFKAHESSKDANRSIYACYPIVEQIKSKVTHAINKLLCLLLLVLGVLL